MPARYDVDVYHLRHVAPRRSTWVGDRWRDHAGRSGARGRRSSPIEVPGVSLPTGRPAAGRRDVGGSLRSRLHVNVLALTVETWHVHFVVAASPHTFGDIVKCAKDAVRHGLKPGRPIWTTGFDKRYCFDEKSVRNRIKYVQQHNKANGWPANPWEFMTISPGSPEGRRRA